MRPTDSQVQHDCAQLLLIPPIDVAWLAGLFERDGSFCVAKQKRYRKSPNRGLTHYLHYCNTHYCNMPIVFLSMTDKDIVERVAALLLSNVRGPYQPQGITIVLKDTFKPLFSISLSGIKALHFCDLVYEFMGQRRREQIDKMRHTEKFTLVEPLVPQNGIVTSFLSQLSS